MTAPPGGGRRQVLDIVALVESVPFDPDRPPWDVTLIDGLEGGRGALYFRAHHVLTDGMGGVSFIRLLLDEAGRPASHPSEPGSAAPGADQGASEPGPERRPGTVTIDFNRALRPLASGLTASLTVEPTDAVDVVLRSVQRGLDVANSVSRQVLVSGGPLSPLPGGRSMTSRFEIISVPGARTAALALGGSRNDLLVAAAAAALGRYHERLGQATPLLRLATPTALRHDGEIGGNWFAPIRVEIPTAAVHPGPHFGVVAERLAQARHESALRFTTALAATFSRLPTRVLVPALHAQADTVDFAATTLPGVRGPAHILGALIEESYPFGPRLGCPINITGFGNDDRLDVGIAIDPAAITDPDYLVECLVEAFQAFVPPHETATERSKDASNRKDRATSPSPSHAKAAASVSEPEARGE
jgi:WS/DGAT/MGAT family acyltransferase